MPTFSTNMFRAAYELATKRSTSRWVAASPRLCHGRRQVSRPRCAANTTGRRPRGSRTRGRCTNRRSDNDHRSPNGHTTDGRRCRNTRTAPVRPLTRTSGTSSRSASWEIAPSPRSRASTTKRPPAARSAAASSMVLALRATEPARPDEHGHDEPARCRGARVGAVRHARRGPRPSRWSITGPAPGTAAAAGPATGVTRKRQASTTERSAVPVSVWKPSPNGQSSEGPTSAIGRSW